MATAELQVGIYAEIPTELILKQDTQYKQFTRLLCVSYALFYCS